MKTSKSERLPRTLQLYVDYIAKAGRPVEFLDVVACTPGVNKFRRLKERGLIRNVVEGYKRDEPYTGPRSPAYVLTEAGRIHVSPSSPTDEVAGATETSAVQNS